MPIKCIICGDIIGGNALPSKCSNCGNGDLSAFIRVDDEDISPKLHKRDKEWLESKLLEGK